MLGTALRKTQVYKDIKEEVQKEAREEGREKGREEGREEAREEARKEATKVMLLILKKRFGTLPTVLQADVTALSLPLLNELTVAALDFSSIENVYSWLQAHSEG